MERNVNRDRHVVPDLDALMRENADPRFDAAATAYGELIGLTPQAADSARRLVRLALEFGTWALLTAQGMTDPEIANLMRRAVAGAIP
jgi:hypothetical protein